MNVIYTNAKNSSAVVGVDTSVLRNPEVQTATVVLQTPVPVPTTEAEILEGVTASSEVFQIDANVSNAIVELNLTDFSASLNIRDTGPLGLFTETEVVPLPDSWYEPLEISKWTRLCWEQQKFSFETTDWWKNIFGLESTTVTPGWFEGFFDFPIAIQDTNPNLLELLNDGTAGSLPTEVIIYPQRHNLYTSIDTISSNKTIEDIQTLYRPRYLTDGPINRWTNLEVVDQEDDPVRWFFEGDWQIDAYGLVDMKQIPLPVHQRYRQSQNYMKLEISTENRPFVVPIWDETSLLLCYYDAFHGAAKKIKIMDVNDGKITYNSSIGAPIDSYGTLTVGTFSTQRPVSVRLQLEHETAGHHISTIEGINIRTQRPFVSSTSNFITDVINPTSDKPYFDIVIDKERMSSLFVPTSAQTGWDIDLDKESHYFESILAKKIVARLHVTKIRRGSEIHLGSFVFNPIGNGLNDIVGITNFDGVLDYDATDQTDANKFKFRFYPQRGSLQLNDVPLADDETPEKYIFRLSEWTLAIEHGLRTGNPLAWMLESTNTHPRYRYDSWDEEHPVRIWRSMNPVDPQYDSVNRLAELAKSARCVMRDVVLEEDFDTTEELKTVILKNNGWKTIYASLDEVNYFGTWHHFDFSFRLATAYKSAKNVKLTASFWYQREVEVPPSQTNTSQNTQTSGPFMQSSGSGGTQLVWSEISTKPGVPAYELDNFSIMQWSHWSPEFHVVDFSSYQYLFFVVWNHLVYQAIGQNGIAAEVSSANGEPVTGSAKMMPSSYTAADPADYYLTKDNYLQFEEECLKMAEKVDEFIKEEVRIRYHAQITMFNPFLEQDQVYDLALHSLDTQEPLWIIPDEKAAGLRFRYEMPEEPENNRTWVGPNFANTAAGDLLAFQVADGETYVTPGLKPAEEVVIIDWDSFDFKKFDMTGAVQDDGTDTSGDTPQIVN